jgi:hypothetical protein
MSINTEYTVEYPKIQEAARQCHIQALPDYLEIAMVVAEKVFNMVSLDRLESLQLCEIGELVEGIDAMLKLVWVAKWKDGHATKFPVLIPEPYAVKHPAEIGITLEHRLMREVFREDTILSL